MKARTSIVAFLLTETVVLSLVVGLAAHMRSLLELIWGHQQELAPDEPLFIAVRTLLVVGILQAVFALRDLYRWAVIVRPQLVLVRLIESVIAALIVLPLAHYTLGLLDNGLELDGLLLRLQIHPFLVVASAGGAFLAAYGLRMHWPRWIKTAGLAERVLVAGQGPMIDLALEEARRGADPAVDLVGLVGRRGSRDGEPPQLGDLDDIEDLARQHEVQRLVVEPSDLLAPETVLRLRLAGVRISDASSFYERLTGRISPASLARPQLFLASASHPFSLATQRVLDVLLALIGLTLFAPFGLLVAVAVKLESKGPLFYVQERMGANGRGFPLAKFRSMRADAEAASGPVWAQANDSRITRVGQWLRKTRVDEVPQLWAVLRNDMAMVGPRPERPFFVQELERQLPYYARRHLVKPGVTGWAQINYSYGNTTDDAFIKLQYDLYYIKHRSLALDIAIILRTIKVVVMRQGAV